MKIDLIIRGICCLVPGVKDLSENITVRSIVGRYLEHSRLLYFYNMGNDELYLSSADMMQRNLDRRVEISFPIENTKLKAELMKTLIKVAMKDNVKAKDLLPDMSYRPVTLLNGTKKVNSQEWLMKHSVKSSGELVKS